LFFRYKNSYLLLASDRNQTVYEFGSATIAKRHEACVLETEGGILLLIYGTLNRSRMLAGRYSSEVYEKFKNGFPYCWEYCIQLYPKVAQTGLDRSQGCQEKHQHTPSNDKVVSDQDMPTSVYLDV